MLNFLKPMLSHSRAVLVLVHVFLIALAYLLAFLLRFDFKLSATQWGFFLQTLPLLLVVRLPVFAWFHLYGGLWRYVSMRDIVKILKAGTLSFVIFSGLVLVLYDYGFPRSVILLDWVLCLALVGGVRLAVRAIRESRQKYRRIQGKRVVIVGAGDAGEMLIREIERNLTLNYEVVGFVDDDRKKQGGRIHGVKIVGTLDELSYLCRRWGVQEILLAIPSATRGQQRQIVEQCRAGGVPFKTIPPLNDLLQGKARIGQLQNVTPEDLLGREVVRLDFDMLRREIKEKSILVTGAAGSIGSELCRQLASFGPEQIILFDRAESGLYFAYYEIKGSYPELCTIPVVGDILNRLQVEEVIRNYAPEIIYHAAAYKNVPLMEEQPFEAIRNNILGTEMLALAAGRASVRKFVLISTDKAVKPVGIMGMTKRMAEGVIQVANGGSTSFVAVRFGNVLGSDGSVLPLFKWQIAKGGPVTVTDPEARRYFMLISEAAQLVLQAGVLARGGEIFFLDMGQPIKIGDLANNLISLSGYEPGKEIQIELTGLRPGERLKEELFMDREELIASEHEKVFVVQNHRFNKEMFRQDLDELRRFVMDRDRESAVDQLRTMASRY